MGCGRQGRVRQGCGATGVAGNIFSAIVLSGSLPGGIHRRGRERMVHAARHPLGPRMRRACNWGRKTDVRDAESTARLTSRRWITITFLWNLAVWGAWESVPFPET